MENKYHRGKIYKIVSSHTDKVYIGSTVQTLAKRMGGHRAMYKMYLEGKCNKCTSVDILCFDDAKIYLIEDFKCESKNELEKRERHYIESMECCNKYIPGRTLKEYRKDNKDKIKEYNIKYFKKNKDYLDNYQIEYRKKNLDMIVERDKKIIKLTKN